MSFGVVRSKIQSLTSIKTDSPQFLEALDAVATFQATTAKVDASNKQNEQVPLRVQLEQKGQLLVNEFLNSFEPLRKKLYDLEFGVHNLDENSQKVEAELEKVRSHTSKYMTILNSLQEEQIILGRRTKLIEDFLETARLSENEMNTIRNCDFSIGSQVEHFFLCLTKLRKIRNLENVLSTGWARTAGLQLVAKTSSLQIIGYERLFLWVRSNCHILSSKIAIEKAGGSIGLSSTLSSELKHVKNGLQLLHDTPDYFEQCCVAIVTKQRTNLRSQFVRALTHGGGPGGSTAIEAHNGDSQRFIGDMLAWVHGTIASEIDHLWSLFDGSSGRNASSVTASKMNTTFSRPFDSSDTTANNATSTSPSLSTNTTNSIRSRVQHLIPTAFDDMIRPLKVRINQAARNEESVVRCYQLSDLIQFYYDRIVKLIPHDSVFMVGMEAAATKIQSRFNELLQIDSSKLLHSTTIYPSDLSVAQSVCLAMETVSRLCEACSSSISGKKTENISKTSISSQENDGSSKILTNINVNEVLNTLLESIQFACQASASGLDSVERGIYSINNMEYLTNELSPFTHISCISSWIEKLSNEKNISKNTLVEDVSENILDKYDLSISLEECKSLGEDKEKILTFNNSVIPKMMTFSTQLFRGDDVEKQFHLMSTPTLRRDVEQQVRITLSNAYSLLYDFLENPGEQLYTSEQVLTLLNM
jgi:hypothetical protein